MNDDRTTVTGRVEVRGRGLLAEGVRAALDGPPEPGGGAGTVLRVDVADHWADGGVAAPGGPARLPVHTEIGTVVVGPLHEAGGPGCATCLALRRRRARVRPELHDALVEQHGDALRSRPSGLLTPLAAGTVGALVAQECRRRLAGEPASTTSAMLLVDLATLAVERHPFLPDPLCPDCGHVPDDRADLATVALTAQPKAGPGRLRVRDVRGDDLEALLVDERCGMVGSVVDGSYGGVAVSIAELRCRPHDASEPGFGRAPTFAEARLTGVLEAMERFGGAAPGGRRPVVVDSWVRLDDAIDPRDFGLHPDDSYRLPHFGFQPFDPAARTRWVWGHSFRRAAPVLVPEGAAYWHTHPEPDLRPFFFEISNGCALGGCLEEAILHGLLEVIERDSFLMTWCARRPAPRIDLGGPAGRAARVLAATVAVDTGCEILAYDTTGDHGVPSVWVMAVHPDDHPERAKVLCSAAAHLDPEKALLSALHELGPARASLDESFPAESDRAREMLDDPFRVETMVDHSLLYGVHEAFDRFDFLTAGTATCDVADLLERTGDRWQGPDLTKDLRDVVDRLEACGTEVVVVDQTTPEHRAAGLHCVKVLVAGTLSMTFGHQHRRTDGIPRLDRALAAGGPSRVPNPHPHPFP